MDPEQFEEFVKIINDQNKLLESIKRSTGVVAMAVALGLLFSGCTYFGLVW